MEEQSAGQVPPARARHLHGTPDGTPVLHQHRQRLLFQLCRASRGNPAVPARGEQTPPLAPTHKSQCLTKPREGILGGLNSGLVLSCPSLTFYLESGRQTVHNSPQPANNPSAFNVLFPMITSNRAINSSTFNQ